MANWQYKIKIGDDIKNFEEHKISINQLSIKISEKLKPIIKSLQSNGRIEIANELISVQQNLKTIEDEDNFDDIMNDLYDIGDNEHLLWLDTFH